MKFALVAALLFSLTASSAMGADVAHIQQNLVSMGYFDGPVNGQMDEPTRAAIKDFQITLGFLPTGSLTPQQLELLNKQVKRSTDEFGFDVVTDEKLGVRFGYPTKLLTIEVKTETGVRYQTQNASAFLEIYSSVMPIDEINLKLVELQTYNQIDEIISNYGDIFIRGRDSIEQFQTHIYDNGRGIRTGYTLIFPLEEEPTYRDLARMIESSFVVFYQAVPSETPIEQILAKVDRADAARQNYDATEFYKTVANSVFTIIPTRLGSMVKNDLTIGSGVAIDAHHLITSCHVTSGWSQLDLFQNDEKIGSAKLVSADHLRDLCVLRTEGDIALTPVKALRSYKSLEVGEKVYAIGSPAGFDRSLSEGIISGLRRQQDMRWAQTTAMVAEGSSGGGLFDTSGNLIGLMSFIVPAGRDLNFAVSVDRE